MGLATLAELGMLMFSQSRIELLIMDAVPLPWEAGRCHAVEHPALDGSARKLGTMRDRQFYFRYHEDEAP